MAQRFDPFTEMDRLFGQASRAMTTGPMPMDLYRKGDVFTAELELPGVDPDSIDIDVDDRTLTIRAERPGVKDPEVQWLSRERASGTSARQLTLGRGLATDRISADYDGGVLTLTIPVAEEAKPRKISISGGNVVGGELSKSESQEQSDES